MKGTKMKFNLPTRDECRKIVESTDAFFVAERVVEGQNVELYNYRLASISDFTDNNAFELRGLCFVQLNDGTWERNILMNKFFNINQTISWMYDDVKDKKIVSVAEKCDGSIISFVKFPNGKVRAKSKMSFESEQAVMAQDYLDNHPILLEEIDALLKKGLTPIFELVGYNNCIVLNYSVPSELILLQIRKEDGSYISANELKNYSAPMCIKQAAVYDLELLEKVASKYTEDEARTKIGDRKFQGLQEMIDFLSN